MCPLIRVTGETSPIFVPDFLKNETREYADAAWGQVTINASARLLSILLNRNLYTPETVEDLFVKKLDMPADIAAALVHEGLRLQVGFLVVADCIFEDPTGRIGGPRHYKNFQIK